MKKCLSTHETKPITTADALDAPEIVEIPSYKSRNGRVSSDLVSSNYRLLGLLDASLAEPFWTFAARCGHNRRSGNGIASRRPLGGQDQSMLEVLQTSTGQLVVAFAALTILITVGAWVVMKFRDGADGSDEIENASDLLTKFREMRQEGHIDEKEYRTIRTDLEGKLSQPASPDIDLENAD